VTFSLDYINGKPLTGNFLYYLLIGLMGFWQPYLTWLSVNAVILLSAAVVLKFHLSQLFLRENIFGSKTILPSFLYAIFAFCLIFVMNIPNRLSFTWLIGQFSPNVWHNSTTIVLMPISLLIFMKSLNWLKEPNLNKDLWWNTFLLPISMLVKPSFFFVFAPAWALVILLKFGLSKKLILGSFPLFTGTSLLVVQILQIYYFYPYHESAGFRIDPFFVWSNWSYFIPSSILVSIAFPLSVTILFWKEVKSLLDFQFSWLMLLFGIILYALLAENGPFWIQVSNNFGWQLYVADFLLFLVSLRFLLAKTFPFTDLSWKSSLSWSLFFIHLGFGILYIIKTPFFGYR
jgi:hypothetical protein